MKVINQDTERNMPSCSKAVPLGRYRMEHEVGIRLQIIRSPFILIILQPIPKHNLRHQLQPNKNNAVSVRRKEIYLFSH